jgi:hypothetical protein
MESRMKRHNRQVMYVGLISLVLAMGAMVQAGVVLDDPLQGSTSGIQDGGTFDSGGWRVTGDYNSIIWHLPHSVSKGAAEFYLKGVNSSYPHKTEHFHMYDYTWYNSDYQYGDPGYRNNPYKHFVRKTGTDDPPRNGSCEIVYATPLAFFELDTAVFSWSTETNYKFRIEWGPEGGNTRLKVFRDGAQMLSEVIAGNYTPTGHSVRLGASPRRAGEGSEIGAVYSYLKVWDLSSYVPDPPTVSYPANGETIKSNLAFIKWTGDSHTDYQVRICTADNPEAGIVWDSGEASSIRDWAWTGALPNLTNYYIYVRLGNSGDWSNWSAAGRWFRVDNSYNDSNIVKVQGNSLKDAGGPFLGLGWTYMAAMWMCKNDRAGFQSDLDFMNDKGFNYMRILSEVPGACSSCYWWGRSINASTYQCQHGAWADPWSDYDQQLKDCIDVAYDQYGIRTEITIFGGAGESFPTYAGRQAHCQRVLNALVGREQKVIQIEVGNEAWQTGFPGSQGITDLRNLAAYIAARTSIPVSLSATCGTNDDLLTLYSGSAADITTEHFSRDLGTSEGHWYPVRDCWRVGTLYPGIAPVSSNEPIGPGSSVNSEDHPIHIVSAPVFAWLANLPMYVFHSRAGVRRDLLFQNMAGVDSLVYLRQILPPDLASWIRNDGIENAAPFTVFCNGQANKYWTDVGGATTGCHRNIGGIKDGEFVCYPQGILGGGVTLQARRNVYFTIYDPLTGATVDTLTRTTGEQFNLPQGPEAYIIKGIFTDIIGPPIEASIDLGDPDLQNCMVLTPVGDGDTVVATVGGRTCRKSDQPNDDYYFYFAVCDSFAYQDSRPDLWISFDYYDYDTGTITLNYDSVAGLGQPGGHATHYVNGGSVTLTNSNTWKHAKFHLTDAGFNNGQNGGADFRFGKLWGPSWPAKQPFYIDKVWVTAEEPLPPIIDEVTPDPKTLVAGTAYSEQLDLIQGTLPVSWSVVEGPAGLQVSSSGQVSGWTPGSADVGDHTITIKAENFEGWDPETWVVRVTSNKDFDLDGDVDQEDFGFFQRCLSGDGVGLGQGCDAADLSLDGDVDPTDFSLFWPCLAGPGEPPGC